MNSVYQIMKLIITLKGLISFTACTLLLVGCASRGEIKGGGTGTQVQLNQRNYKVIQAGAVGKSHGFRLLGIIPIVSPNYADAKKNLYESVGENLKGRAIALANQTEDDSSLYLILFSIPRVTITADLVEFIDPTPGK
jgi:hypothetical protein